MAIFFSFQKRGIVSVQTKPVKGSFLCASVCLFKEDIMGENKRWKTDQVEVEKL